MDDRTAKLLLKAVRALPQKEQDQVLTGLVREAFTEPWMGVRPSSPPDVVLSYGTMGSPGQTAMLPVRLPPELHDRLRRWSTDHGFSMAGVVRGLVERFLDQQTSAKPRRRPAATKPKKRTTARG